MKITCYNCNKKFALHPDLEPKQINGKSYCNDCYYDEVGKMIEQHPIMITKFNSPEITTAKELRDKFEKDLKHLQTHCKHKPSQWMDYMWAPGHYSPYKIKVCLICDKILDKKGQCYQCSCETTSKNSDGMSGYCNSCKEKITKKDQKKGRQLLKKLVRESRKKEKET